MIKKSRDNGKTTSFWRNYVKVTFWGNNNVIIAWCVCWELISPGQNGHYFADNIMNAFSQMKCFVFDSNYIEICSIDNKSTLVQVMAWRRTGDKLLPEPMLTQFTDAYMSHTASMS